MGQAQNKPKLGLTRAKPGNEGFSFCVVPLVLLTLNVAKYFRRVERTPTREYNLTFGGKGTAMSYPNRKYRDCILELAHMAILPSRSGKYSLQQEGAAVRDKKRCGDQTSMRIRIKRTPYLGVKHVLFHDRSMLK